MSIKPINSRSSYRPLQENAGFSSTFSKVREYIENHFPELTESLGPDSYMVKLAERKGFDAFVHYMNTPQHYQIVTRKSTLFCHITLGHHSLMRLPGGRQCEWSSTRRFVAVEEFTQLEIRSATGATIERIWNTHLEQSPSYQSFCGLLTYLPFQNDCFTYINHLLRSNGEPPLQLTRFLVPHAAPIEDLLSSY